MWISNFRQSLRKEIEKRPSTANIFEKIQPYLDCLDGKFFSEKNKYHEAIELYERAIKLEPRYAEPYKLKGKALHSLKEYEEAVACFDKAIRQNPKEADYFALKGNSYYALKQFKKSFACYDQAVQIKLANT